MAMMNSISKTTAATVNETGQSNNCNQDSHQPNHNNNNDNKSPINMMIVTTKSSTSTSPLPSLKNNNQKNIQTKTTMFVCLNRFCCFRYLELIDSVYASFFPFINLVDSLMSFFLFFPCFLYRNPPWWNRRTRLERLLCAVTAITLMMCIAMSISLAMVRYQRRQPPQQQQPQQDSRFNIEHGQHPSQSSSSSSHHYNYRLESPTAQQLVNRENEKAKLSSVIDSSSSSSSDSASSILSSPSSSSSMNRIFEKQGKSLKNTKLLSTSSSDIKWPKTPATDVCLSKGCVRAASELITNMNELVSPCDDFYQFACGGWIKNQVIPDDRTTVSVFSLLQDELNHKLRGLFYKFINRCNIINFFLLFPLSLSLSH